MPVTLEGLVSMVVTVALVMFSAMVHEVAHGLAAHLCGDDTAKEAGRLTLDPRAHLDPIGSVVLPLAMALMGGPVFAFARPVPYNPARLRHPRRDELIVALAGPASNLLQALVGTALVAALLSPAALAAAPDAALALLDVLLTYVSVNLVLCFFNLIPLPPLDGSKVVLFFLSGRARARYYELQNYSMAILLAALYLLPGLLRVDPLGAYLDATAGRLFGALIGAVL
ncbi:site-2 protease family protein [Thermophilibacter mediterraneus]|uniref:site-2 protease family protein n=1 Tax=Thermophilibacter mediterraneus TaxID=1871031 RepID=UPI000ACB9BE5|nr:site-2 protease family protein [Thermophilibacter mediterraneus]